jgi:hypothetical protein
MNIAKSSTPSLQDTLTKHQDLHSQLMALSFDDSFLPRLLRETGWTTEQCDRTLQEYRRFLFLHRTANHTVIPSQMVDKVWHLHLLYTRSYWEDLCDNILKTPLHHHPGSATGEQRHFFWGNYEATLKSYETIFRHSPPADIWPTPALQFAYTKDPTYWKIPKPQLKLPIIPRIHLQWFHYGAIALITYTAAFFLHIDIINPVSILKYGLAISAIVYFIKFLTTTYDDILTADRLSHIPLKINPKTRIESDEAKSDMNNLTTNQAQTGFYVLCSFLAAFAGLYIQACEMTNSAFLILGNHWGWLIFTFCIMIVTLVMTVGLTSCIANQILRKLKRQNKITLANTKEPKNWQREVYQNRRRICKDCTKPMEHLSLNSVKQLLTKEEQFAQTLNSIDIHHSHDHCATCSPEPDRENFLFLITPKNNYFNCPKCQTIARKTTIRTLQAATANNEGKELIREDCAYCQDQSKQIRSLPKIATPSCGDHSCSTCM